MTTIVSAFIYLSNNNNRSLEKYIECGKKLLALDQNKIVFIDEQVFEEFEKCKNDKTILIKVKLEDLYLYKYNDKLKNTKVNTINKGKDTLEYFFVICNKTEWMREAINLNIFETNQFIWIDFGIYHVIKKFPLNFEKYEKVRIASIWNLDLNSGGTILKNIAWYFAGGVFGGNRESLIQFADLMKEKCNELIENLNHLMWEVNVWYLIWQNNKDLFLPYNCDHNQSIIDNY
jgi:hypothetical protein